MMFCNDCICDRCPYGLSCDYCDKWLDGHILIVDGCDGKRECNVCLLDDMLGDGATILREALKSKNDDKIDDFFDNDFEKYYK